MKFVFDIDGTICFDGQTINEKILQALQLVKESGHDLIFASARSYRDCENLLGSKFSKEKVIGLNGGLFYDKGELVTKWHLGQKDFKDILSYCKEYNLPYFIYDALNFAVSQRKMIPFISSVDESGQGKEVTLSEMTYAIKMVIYLGNHPDLEEDLLVHFERFDDVTVSYHENEKCLYITPKGISKAAALKELDLLPYIAFGNDKNDIELFNEALYAYQVGNYQPLKQYSDQVLEPTAEVVASTIKDLLESFQEPK
ncbi:HAD-IIB family hydrolase [Streptococcus thoraltensis]